MSAFQLVKFAVAAAAALVVAGQCRKPSWLLGRLIARSMNRSHAGLTTWGLSKASELKSDAERKVAEAKVEIEVDRAKAKIERQVDTEASKDERVFRAVSADAKGAIETERAKDESVFSGVSADAKSQYEKLQAQQAQLKSAISTKTGEARTKLQADLDRVAVQIAASEAAMDEYYARRDEVGLV